MRSLSFIEPIKGEDPAEYLKRLTMSRLSPAKRKATGRPDEILNQKIDEKLKQARQNREDLSYSAAFSEVQREDPELVNAYLSWK